MSSLRSALPLLLVLGAAAPPGFAALPTSAPAPAPQETGEESVAELVARGRELLEAGDLVAAVEVLRRADAEDEGALETRAWLVRALIEREYLNDALDLVDSLANRGEEGPMIDYLYGMAFVYKARKYIRQGVNLGVVGMQYGDGVRLLASATEADPERFSDAFLPLAEAAWHSEELEIARAAATKALEIAPDDPAAALMLGEVAFSQFVAANGDEATQEAADAHWQAAVDAFGRAARNEAASDATRGLAHKKVGDAQAWKSDLEAASRHYAAAMGHDPSAVDYGQVLNSLGADPFLACIEAGAQAFGERHGEQTQADATLQWWLGWSRFTHQQYDEAAEAFRSAYAKWPAYTNCNWYLGLCAYHGQDYERAVEYLVTNFELSPEDLAASINGNFDLNSRIVEYLIGQCAQTGKNLEAAKLSEALTVAAPRNSLYWNNAGLFYRDHADRLARSGKETDPQVLRRFYEKSLAAYEAALALEPDNPNYLNDTAVVLHYNLNRDLERALELYRESYAAAVQQLEREDLDDETRGVIQIAHRDSQNNLRLLERQLEKRRKEREEAERKQREEEERKRREEEERKKREEEKGGGGGDS